MFKFSVGPPSALRTAWVQKTVQKRLSTKSQTKKYRDKRFSPFERASQLDSREYISIAQVESGLYTGTLRNAFDEGGRAQGRLRRAVCLYRVQTRPREFELDILEPHRVVLSSGENR